MTWFFYALIAAGVSMRLAELKYHRATCVFFGAVWPSIIGVILVNLTGEGEADTDLAG
jgi:hypothetical protein